jgi:hypothetical protein
MLRDILRNLLMPAPTQFQERGGAIPPGGLTWEELTGPNVDILERMVPGTPLTQFDVRDIGEGTPQWEPGPIPDPFIDPRTPFTQSLDQANLQQQQAIQQRNRSMNALVLKDLLNKQALEQQSAQQDALNLDEEIKALQLSIGGIREQERQMPRHPSQRPALTPEQQQLDALTTQRDNRLRDEFLGQMRDTWKRGGYAALQGVMNTLAPHQVVPVGSPEHEAWQQRRDVAIPDPLTPPEPRPLLDPNDPRNVFSSRNILDPEGAPDFPEAIARAQSYLPVTPYEHGGDLAAELVVWMLPLMPQKLKTAAAMQKWVPKFGEAVAEQVARKPNIVAQGLPPWAREWVPTAAGTAGAAQNITVDALDAILKSTFLEYTPEETGWATGANVLMGMGIRGTWKHLRNKQQRRDQALAELFEEARRVDSIALADNYIVMKRADLADDIATGRKPPGSKLDPKDIEEAAKIRAGDPLVRRGLRTKASTIADLGVHDDLSAIYGQASFNLRQVDDQIRKLLQWADMNVGPLPVKGSSSIIAQLENLQAHFATKNVGTHAAVTPKGPTVARTAVREPSLQSIKNFRIADLELDNEIVRLWASASEKEIIGSMQFRTGQASHDVRRKLFNEIKNRAWEGREKNLTPPGRVSPDEPVGAGLKLLFEKNPEVYADLGATQDQLSKLLTRVRTHRSGNFGGMAPPGSLLPSDLREINTLFNKFRSFEQTVANFPQANPEFYAAASHAMRKALNEMRPPPNYTGGPPPDLTFKRWGHRSTERAPQVGVPRAGYTPERINVAAEAGPPTRGAWDTAAVTETSSPLGQQFDYLMADASNYLKLMEDIEKKIYSGGWTGNVRTEVAGLLGDAPQAATAGAAVLTGRDFLALRVGIMKALGRSTLTDSQKLAQASRWSAQMAATRTGSELRGKLPIGGRSLLAGGASVYGVDRQAVAPIPRIEVPEITQPAPPSAAALRLQEIKAERKKFIEALTEDGVPLDEAHRLWIARSRIDAQQ